MSLSDYGIVCENEVDYNTNDVKIILEFQKRFNIIKAMGFVPSHRSNNTGIGKTFEDLIGVKENNYQNVDFMGLIEIKSKRELSLSMLTLFTKSPDHPSNSNSYLKDTYGMLDTEYNLKKLHTTISATEFNTFGNDIGFKLECNDDEKRLYILVREQVTGKIIDKKVYYTYDKLDEIISSKCKNIAYVSAESKIIDGKEHFKFTGVKLLTGFTFEKFLSCVKKGIIKYDIRIGTYKSGQFYGKVHDHGSGFRVKKNEICSIFKVTDL